MINSPSQSSVGKLLSGSSATNSSYVQRRSFDFFVGVLGLVVITDRINLQTSRQSSEQASTRGFSSLHCRVGRNAI